MSVYKTNQDGQSYDTVGWFVFVGGHCVSWYPQWDREYSHGPLSGSGSKGLDSLHRTASFGGDTTGML